MCVCVCVCVCVCIYMSSNYIWCKLQFIQFFKPWIFKSRVQVTLSVAINRDEPRISSQGGPGKSEKKNKKKIQIHIHIVLRNFQLRQIYKIIVS